MDTIKGCIQLKWRQWYYNYNILSEWDIENWAPARFDCPRK